MSWYAAPGIVRCGVFFWVALLSSMSSWLAALTAALLLPLAAPRAAEPLAQPPEPST